MKARAEWIKNPPEELVNDCCKHCPLFPSKPGQEHESVAVIAAYDSAARLKRLIDAKLAPIIFKDPNLLSARRCAALFGFNEAEARSERNRIPKEPKNKKKNVDYID